ncbi:sulfotransferase [Rhodanobacter sp. AS-Z3]|uniref:tetratricopeptide repeat-containing sulfotransferase family protein n=1 Tax=Rhodanobacter sp. AS-Z3 TaxID=3031330 RepID=UPI0024799883|nr:sulfotransferase [Rhodanobacter sp. AS-Z3]WEN14268.1 sulfotransferase [Rhodanobacter sp. AS-Z3]
MNLPPDTREFALGRQARQLFEQQQFDAACAVLETLVHDVPENPFVRMDLATVLLRCGRLRDGTAQLLEAARGASVDPQFGLHLARVLLSVGEVVAARSCLDALELPPDLPAPLLAEQAYLRWMMKDLAAARRLIDRALVAGADSPREYHLQAMLMQFAGELQPAGRVLEACLQRWPAFGDAALARSSLWRQTPETNHLDFLRRQLERVPTTTRVPAELANRAAFEAALFKELDDLDRPDEAWQALARCNALMHQVSPYDAAGESAVADALIKTSVLLTARASSSAADAEGPQPIFIVGMPRSGTTLLDRMLSSHSEVASAGEITDFLRQLHEVTDAPAQGVQGLLSAIERSVDIDFAELGARYLAQTQWRAPGCRYFVDKLPANIRMVAHIRRALPHARILHMVRDPMEVCFSNFSVMFGSIAAYSYDQPALAHYYAQYVRLAQHWRSRLPDAMFEVRYADLVREPETTLQKVLEHCGLPLEDACLHPERNTAPVATPSSIQVREAVHTRGLDRWHRYAQHLDVLRENLAGMEPCG